MEQIMQAQPADLPEIRRLWEICFPAEGDFNDYFFQEIFDLSNVLLMKSEDRVLSMTQEIPMTLSLGGKVLPVTYIYGACTAPEARGQGCMERLLQASFDRDRARGRAASLLIPAQPSLFDFYQRFGYKTCFYQGSQIFEEELMPFPAGYTLSLAQEADWQAMQEIYQEKVSGLYLLRHAPYWQGQIRQFAALGGQAFLLQKNKECSGYAFVWPEAGNLWAQEMLCRESEDAVFFAQLIRQHYREEKIKITGIPQENKQPIAMIRYRQDYQEEQGYLNLLWN